MNAYWLLQEIKANVIDTGNWSDPELLRKLNLSYRKAFNMVRKASGDRLVTSTTLTPVASVITLPSDFSRFVYMEDVATGSPIEVNTRVSERRLSRMTALSSDLIDYDAYFVGDTIEVNADSYTSQVRLWYEPKAVDLHAGAAGVGSGASTLVFESGHYPSKIDDYYNNQTVEIIRAGSNADVSSTISDYVGSTVTATITGTIAAADNYGTLPKTPQEADLFIIMDATVMCMAKPGSALDPKYFEYYLSQLKLAREDLMSWLSSRKVSSGSVTIKEIL